jgi:pimeloyl-ACP methyl ester carboxylesterase
VLALSAELDLLAPPKAVAELHRDVPGVEFATVVGAAHSIHWEKPAETAAAINAFLR